MVRTLKTVCGCVLASVNDSRYCGEYASSFPSLQPCRRSFLNMLKDNVQVTDHE